MKWEGNQYDTLQKEKSIKSPINSHHRKWGIEKEKYIEKVNNKMTGVKSFINININRLNSLIKFKDWLSVFFNY